MEDNFVKRTGIFNVVGISMLATLMFFLSLLFLGSKADADQIKAHWFRFSLQHIGMAMFVALVVTLGFIVLNFAFDGIFYRKINGRRLLFVLTCSLLVSFVAAFIGNLLLLFLL